MEIFYHNYKTDQGISSSSESKKANVSEAINLFLTLNSDLENFFGIVDAFGKTIQFLLEKKDKWLVDIINLPDFVNDQKYANDNECIDLITKVFQYQKVVVFPGMRKVDTMSETLEELLRK